MVFKVNVDRLRWAESVLFLRLACQNTHPIKRFRRPLPRDLAPVQFVRVCVCQHVFRTMSGRANVPVLSSLLHTWCCPWCWITVNDKTTNHVISFRLFCLCAHMCTYLCMFVCLCTQMCMCVCVQCITRAYCQRCTTVEVATARAVSLSSLPVASN